ncbi:class I SAM-dependent methyltransferase [Leptolyngbya sp. 15MV]|nr:class I SAM-dependent methyltransferase [Leptolyngbya sp. 15MV]
MARRPVLTTEQDPRVAELRRRLDDFYASTTTYDDFKHAASSKPDIWAPIQRQIEQIIRRKGSADVLEFGAGRTGFPASLGAMRPGVRFVAQDVTPQNADYLAAVADRVHVGDLSALSGPFDTIFSTFVWEHITNPAATLAHLLRILAPGGSLFIACPRYDAPGYIPPSARHYPALTRARLALWLMARRLDRRPRFDIHVDPAVLERPWFRDADAIHWVRLQDFAAALPEGYRLTRVRLHVRGLKRRLWESALLAFVRIDRPD